MDTNIITNRKKTSVSFLGQTIYLGIDVHKKNWSVTVYLGDAFFQTFHQESKSSILSNYLHSHFPGANYKACYEAGFCGFSVQRELSSLDINCIVVNPADVPQTNKGSLSKTDASDSKRLAIALSKGMLNAIHIPDRITEADRQLIRYRKKIQIQLQGRRKSLRSIFHIAGISIPAEHDKPYWTANFVKWLRLLVLAETSLNKTIQLIIDDVEVFRKRLLETNKLIRELSVSDRYNETFTVLSSAPGIGIITAMTMLTEIGNIERFDNFARFNSFIGLCPSEFSSGEDTRKGGMTPRSHSAIRPLLIEAAWIAIRVDPALALRFQELVATRTKKRAIVVIARKLLSRIYCIWTKKQEYEKGTLK